jgi:FixJ family two-component response regulator
MNGATRIQKIEQIAAEAVHWLSVLESADEKTRAAFLSWLTTSPQHVEEFLRAGELSAKLSRVLPRKVEKEQLPVVFVVDDDPEVQRALSRLLRAAGYDTRTFGSGEELLDSPDVLMFAGCIILDLVLPGEDGLELQDRLVASGCDRPIIFLTGYGDISKTVRAMKAGAVDFLTKPVDSRELLTAVEEALRLDAERRAASSTRSAVAKRLSTLTARERQVLDQVVAGRMNRQIAADLGIVERTIKIHRARVMRKMRAGSLVELLRLATIAGIDRSLLRAEMSLHRESNSRFEP